MSEVAYIITTQKFKAAYEAFLKERDEFMYDLYINVTARRRFRPWRRPRLWWAHWRQWRTVLRKQAERF